MNNCAHKQTRQLLRQGPIELCGKEVERTVSVSVRYMGRSAGMGDKLKELLLLVLHMHGRSAVATGEQSCRARRGAVFLVSWANNCSFLLLTLQKRSLPTPIMWVSCQFALPSTAGCLLVPWLHTATHQRPPTPRPIHAPSLHYESAPAATSLVKHTQRVLLPSHDGPPSKNTFQSTGHAFVLVQWVQGAHT